MSTRSACEKKRRTNRPQNKTAKTTPCTVQIIGEFGVERFEPPLRRNLHRRAQQEHDGIMATTAGLGSTRLSLGPTRPRCSRLIPPPPRVRLHRGRGLN